MREFQVYFEVIEIHEIHDQIREMEYSNNQYRHICRARIEL